MHFCFNGLLKSLIRDRTEINVRTSQATDVLIRLDSIFTTTEAVCIVARKTMMDTPEKNSLCRIASNQNCSEVNCAAKGIGIGSVDWDSKSRV